MNTMYQHPEIKLIRFEDSDIIATSLDNNDDEPGTGGGNQGDNHT